MVHIFLVVTFLFHFVVFLRCVVLIVLTFYSFFMLLLLCLLCLFFITLNTLDLTLFCVFIVNFLCVYSINWCFFVLFKLRFFALESDVLIFCAVYSPSPQILRWQSVPLHIKYFLRGLFPSHQTGSLYLQTTFCAVRVPSPKYFLCGLFPLPSYNFLCGPFSIPPEDRRGVPSAEWGCTSPGPGP